MSMADRDGFIWYDGKLVPWRNATTHVLTHSLHYGLAVFEGVRAYNTDHGTAIFRLKEHTERWFNSAKIYMMKMPYDSKTLMQAHIDVVRANKLVDCYLRPIAFYGSEKMGVSPKGASVHVAIAAWPWGAYLGADGLEKGIRVKTSSYSRHHVNVNMARAIRAVTVERGRDPRCRPRPSLARPGPDGRGRAQDEPGQGRGRRRAQRRDGGAFAAALSGVRLSSPSGEG